jgi:hemerythrin-like domain-containing protein
MKRSERLQPLSREHHQALVFSKRLLQIFNNDPDAAAVYWKEWREVAAGDLLRHFAEEESRFLALLRNEGAGRLEHRLLEEHRQLRLLLEDDQVEAATLFAGLLKDHVRFEERELFGWIEAHSEDCASVPGG